VCFSVLSVWTIRVDYRLILDPFFFLFRSDVDMLHIYHGDGLIPDPSAVGWQDTADKPDNFTLIDILGYNNFLQYFNIISIVHICDLRECWDV
jgi:hypothetical protein